MILNFSWIRGSFVDHIIDFYKSRNNVMVAYMTPRVD